MKFLNLRSLQMALLVAAAGSSACKPKLTYVHVKVLPAAAGEPAAITDIELDLDLAGKTSTLHLTDPAHGPIQLPTDVTLEVKTGAGQLAIIAICKNASGAEVDRATGTVTVSSGAIAEASLRLPGGKPDVRPVEAAHEFGSVPVGTSSPTVNATFHNAGFKPTGLVAVALGGLGSGDWLIVTDGCSGTALPAGGDCAVSLQFIPFDVGPLAATLIFSANPGSSPVIALTGTGVPNPQNLAVTVAGNGSGTIVCAVNGGAATACAPSYNYGDSVMITATPATGSNFTGWSGNAGCPGGGGPCTLTMTSNQTTTATFTLQTFIVTITKSGNGTVTSPDTTLSCSANTCMATVNYGSTATLNGAGASGSIFVGWSAGSCAGTGSCVLSSITSDQGVTASFPASFCAASVTAGQAFGTQMQGCPGKATYANRATLCGAGAHACNSNEWVQNQGSTAPAHHYWTDDALNYSASNGACGAAACNTGNCFASTGNTYTINCGATTPMRVCAGTGASGVGDPEGNQCTWTGCGFNSIEPNRFFGGCSGNTTAGALCCSNAQHQYFVSTSGNDSNAGTAVAPFKTITHALAVSVAKDTVFVKTGIYDAANTETFPLNVPAGVNLIGDEPSRGAGPLTRIGGTVAPGAGATVAGFTITNGSYGINAGASGAIIRNNTITGNGSFGIYVKGSTNHLILLNSVSNNSQGILYQSSTAGGKTENNTFTANSYNIEFDNPGSDLGGGAAGSVGNNIFSCSPNADLWAGTQTVTANNNKWDHAIPTTSSTTYAGTGVDIFDSTLANVSSFGASQAPNPCPACSASAVASQSFDGIMIGCAGLVPFANRATLCPSYCHVCSANEWLSHHGAVAPGHNYWTNDLLGYSTTAPTCLSTSGPSFCSTASEGPGGVCAPTQPDPEGNNCNNPNHALCPDTTNSPNQFFGACNGVIGSTTVDRSGTLCCCP